MKRSSTAGWLGAVVGLAAVCILGVSATAQERVITANVSFAPVQMESRGPVFTWESEGTRVFAAPGGGEVRQGPVRVAAPSLVVWLDKAESLAPGAGNVIVRIYARGAGPAGEPPVEPARLVQGSQVREAGLFYLRMRSKLAFTWQCQLVRDKEPLSIASYVRAAHVIQGIEPDYVSDLIPEAPPFDWKATVTETLTANEITFFADEETKTVTVVYMGDVRGAYRNMHFNAEAAVLWLDEGTKRYEVYARGNVRLTKRPGAPDPTGKGLDLSFIKRMENMRADEVYIFPDRQKALAAGAELRLLPPEDKGISQMVDEDVYVVQGREVYALDASNLYIREGSFTTDPFGHPHYKITGERVRVVRHDPSLFVTTWRPRLRAGAQERKVIGLPFLGIDMGQREGFLLNRVEIGSSSKFGFFVKTRWRPTHLGLDPEWLDKWSVDLDYYADRGPAVGTDVSYSFEDGLDHPHKGDLWAYYVHDSADEDDTERAVPRANRGAVHWRHRVPWDEHWRTDAEVYYLSDEGFLREFFEQRFENEKPPESYLLTRYRDGNAWLGLLAKRRINDFLTQPDEYSAQLELIGVPLGGLVYTGGLELGFYDLRVTDQFVMPDPPSLWRVHTEHRLSYPFNIGAVRVDPFVRVFGTYASKGFDPDALDFTGAASRLAAGGGVRMSTDFSRAFTTSSELLDINRLRHVVTPYIELEATPVATTGSEEFIQLGMADPWPFGGSGPRPGHDIADAIDKRFEARFGLRQRLQTKRGEPGNTHIVDWMELDVAVVVRDDDSVGVPVDDNYIEADFDWRLAPNLTIRSHDNRLSLGDGADVFSIGAGYELSQAFGIGVDYHYISDRTSTISADMWAKLSDRYALIVQERLELDSTGAGDDGNMETLVILRRFFHKWVLDLGVNYDRADDEMLFMVGFMPLELAGRRSTTSAYEL